MRQVIILNSPSASALRLSLESKKAVMIKVKDENGQITEHELFVHSLTQTKRKRGEGMLNFFGRTINIKFDMGERNSFIYFL